MVRLAQRGTHPAHRRRTGCRRHARAPAARSSLDAIVVIHINGPAGGAETLELTIEPSAELVLAPDEVLVVPPADPHASAVVLARAESMAVLEKAGLLTPRVRRKPFQQLVDRFTQSRRDGDLRNLRELADEPLEGGYLKLSEESRRQLAHGTPVVATTGGMLGMVNDEKGHRKHLLRFTDYKTAADPNLIRAASTLKAMAALQEQLEAVEERLIEVQKTLGRLCQELDYDRAELAYVRSDALKLLYEASEHPETSAELEHDMREQIETRCAELAAVGTLLRDISDPEARRLLDHFQQISRYKLSRQRPLVEGLLARHGEVFSDQAVLTATA